MIAISNGGFIVTVYCYFFDIVLDIVNNDPQIIIIIWILFFFLLCLI